MVPFKLSDSMILIVALLPLVLLFQATSVGIRICSSTWGLSCSLLIIHCFEKHKLSVPFH